MTLSLALWNNMTGIDAAQTILPCCGSTAWARGMAASRPVASGSSLFALSDKIWAALPREAWIEAFNSHPRIGQTHATATAQSLAWSAGEQGTPDEQAKAALAIGNARYEEKFGRIFIVCATGKTPQQMLEILEARLSNEPDAEWYEAAEQQRQITQIRLRKWLTQEAS